MGNLDNKEHTRENRAVYDERYIGQKFNSLKVIGIDYIYYPSGNRQTVFCCQCDCGNVKMIQPHAVVTEKVKSCGCLRMTANGNSNDRLYAIWDGMQERCYNEKSPAYRYYGAKGISVCEEWRNSYEIFKEWAYANGYDDTAKRGDCTIDRIDPHGNYEPDNCRWVDMDIQLQNRRPSSEWVKRQKRKIEMDGESLTMDEWCERYGITPEAVYYRMHHMGLTLEEAIKSSKHQGVKIA